MAHLGFVADVVLNGHSRLREGNYLYGSFGCDFATTDGRRVMIVALTDGHWRALVDLTGLSDSVSTLEKMLDVDLSLEQERYRFREVLAALMRPWFESRTFDEVVAELELSHVLWGPYRTIEQLVSDPDSPLCQSDLMQEIEHPGIGTFPTPRSVLRFPALRDLAPVRAPCLGEHTDQVLSSFLNLTDDELVRLRNDGVIGPYRR